MKLRFLAVALAAFMLPLALGCGGPDTSYKDREGDVDAETVDLQPPGDMTEAPSP